MVLSIQVDIIPSASVSQRLELDMVKKLAIPLCTIFKSNDRNKFVLIFTIFMIVVGCNDCRYYAKEFKKREFVIIVRKKYVHDYKQIAFEGVDQRGKKALFDEVGFRDLYDMVKVGDTLKKELGTADIKIFRKDTCLVCPWYCNGQIIE